MYIYIRICVHMYMCMVLSHLRAVNLVVAEGEVQEEGVVREETGSFGIDQHVAMVAVV